jgi:hypothetical protein
MFYITVISLLILAGIVVIYVGGKSAIKAEED